MERNIEHEPIAGFETFAISRISWGAIFAGVVVAFAVQLMLSILGIGIGASTIDPMREANPLEGMGIGSIVWLLISTLLSLFLGGWVAAHMAGTYRRIDSAMHGIITWGFATLLMTYMVTTSVGNIIGGAAGMLGQGVGALAKAAGGGAQMAGMGDMEIPGMDIQLGNLKQQARSALGISGKPGEGGAGQEGANLQENAEVAKAVSRFFSEEQPSPADRETLVNTLVQKGGMDRQQAEAKANEWQQSAQKVRGNFEQAKAQLKQQGRQAAETAAGGVAKTAIWLFVAMLLSIVAAAIGGAVGTSSEAPEAME